MTTMPTGTDVPESSGVVHIDHREPSFVIDPFTAWEALRSEHPVAWSDVYEGFWIATGFREVDQVLHDHETFCSSQGIDFPRNSEMPNIVLIETDPPLHRDFRTLLNPSFSPHRVELLKDDIGEIVTGLIDEFIEDGRVDIVARLARPLPRIILFRLLGVPLDDAPHVAHLLYTASRGFRNDPDAARRAGIDLYAYLTDLVGRHRTGLSEQHDVLSGLVRGVVEGRPITDDEVARLLIVVFAGGMNTVKSQIAGTLHYLAQHPDHRQRLIDDPANVPRAVEEFLRLVTPIHGVFRTATRDTVLGGKQIRQGQKVYTVIASANRDETEFADGNGCVLDRHPNRHAAFGLGVHRCVGSHLARLEFRTALEQVLLRLPDFRIPPGAELVWDTGSLARGIDQLPLEFTPGPRVQPDTNRRDEP